MRDFRHGSRRMKYLLMGILLIFLYGFSPTGDGERESGLTAVKSGSSTVTLFWDSAGKGNTIFRAMSQEGPYEAVAEIEEGAFRWTDTTAAAGSVYYYKMAGAEESLAEQNYLSVVLLAKPVVTVQNNGAGTQISWKKVEQAEAYEIYASAQKEKGYRKIAEVAQHVLQYTDTDAVLGKNTYYRVQAIRNGADRIERSGLSVPVTAGANDTKRLEVPVIYQMPELPTGCEITALTMVLHYYNFSVSKLMMADVFLPYAAHEYFQSGGRLYGPDWREAFLGDPWSDRSGIVCGAGAIETAANRYFSQIGSKKLAVDITGTEPAELYEYVNSGTPVLVWTTISMAERKQDGASWYAVGTDDFLTWSSSDHCAVLTGEEEDALWFVDPISGEVSFSKAQFEYIYQERGSQAVLIQ